METLQSQTTEYQYQIRELGDRVALLEGELTDAQREASPANGAGMSPEEVARLISAAEAKYEARLAELRGQLETIEKERNEADAEWNSKVAARALEVEELKRVIGKGQKSEVDHKVVEEKLREDISALKEEVKGYQRQQIEFQRQVERIKESEVCPCSWTESPPQADWGLDRMTYKPSYQNPWRGVLPLKPRFRSSRAGRPSFGPAIR